MTNNNIFVVNKTKTTLSLVIINKQRVVFKNNKGNQVPTRNSHYFVTVKIAHIDQSKTSCTRNKGHIVTETSNKSIFDIHTARAATKLLCHVYFC